MRLFSFYTSVRRFRPPDPDGHGSRHAPGHPGHERSASACKLLARALLDDTSCVSPSPSLGTGGEASDSARPSWSDLISPLAGVATATTEARRRVQARAHRTGQERVCCLFGERRRQTPDARRRGPAPHFTKRRDAVCVCHSMFSRAPATLSFPSSLQLIDWQRAREYSSRLFLRENPVVVVQSYNIFFFHCYSKLLNFFPFPSILQFWFLHCHYHGLDKTYCVGCYPYKKIVFLNDIERTKIQLQDVCLHRTNSVNTIDN